MKSKITILILWALACARLTLGQTPRATILQVDVENIVAYVEDTADSTRFATIQTITTPIQPRNFGNLVILGDIVAVNGQPVKGTAAFTNRGLNLRPAPTPGQALADVNRNGQLNQVFEILRSDGTPIGSIMTLGLAVGIAAPPGAPVVATQGNNAIIGGTGAFLGVRGYSGQSVNAQTIANRQASMTEDPANRRAIGGGRTRFQMLVIPFVVPEIVETDAGPQVLHPDFSAVTTANPARAGEVLTVLARGLGPTRPALDPGETFPADRFYQINSPVDVLLAGKRAQIVNAIGEPGSTDLYRIDFRVPDGAAAGSTTLQLVAAWIPGSEVKIAVR